MDVKLYHCLLITLISIACLAFDARGDEVEQEGQIARLVAQLDSDKYAIRHQAHIQLLEVGENALPALHSAVDSKSTEQRYRVRQLIRAIRRKALQSSFAKIARREDSEIDLDEGMLLIARILDTAVDRQAIEKQLDDLAKDVRERMGNDVEPKDAAPKEFVDAMISVLRDDFKLSGNVTDYDNPINSSLAHVLATRKGLPILICHVAVSIAERLDVPIVGLAVPRRYMIKYDGSRAPKGHPQGDIIIDPFGGWEILTPDEVKEIIPSFDHETDLIPSPRRDSLTRMLRNLVSDLSDAAEFKKAAETQQIILLLENSQASEAP